MALLDLFTHKYPSTDFHELNLDWCIAAVLELQKAFESFSAVNKLLFANPLQHDLTKSYAKNTIVLDDYGNAWLSLQVVPKGVQLSNTDYWLEVFNFEAYTSRANRNFTDNYFVNTDRAPYPLAASDWVILDDVLYKATAAIATDDQFVIGGNLVHFTVEQFLKDFITSVNTTLNDWYNQMTGTINQYKNDIDASELAYRNQLAQDIATTTESLQAQLNLAISGVTVDSEVINARLGANGITYSTLGGAIRSQIIDCNKGLKNVYDGIYDGYYYSVLDFEQGWIDSSGNYTNNDGTRHITKPFAMNTDFIEIINNSAVQVAVVYLSAYTDFTNFTYSKSRYVAANGGHLVVDKTENFFSIELLTYDQDDLDAVQLVSNSKLEYLSHENISNIPVDLRKELYNGYVIDHTPWEHGWITSSGTYDPASSYYISPPVAMDAEYTEVYNGSNTNIYLCYLSRFVDYSDFTYDSFVTIGAGGKWTINQSKAYFFVGVPSSDATILPLIEVRKVSNLEYLSKVNIGQLPDYWETYLNNKMNTLKWGDMSIGRDGVSFAFITDVHIDANNMMSPKLLYWLTRHTNVRDVICGGDIIEGYNTAEHASDELFRWMQDTSEIKIVNIHGNHDNNTNGQTDPTQNLDNIHFYALECRQSEYFVTFVDNEMYGYSDNDDQKMRYIYLDTGAPDSEVISDTQIEWMKDRIEELPSGWFVTIFCHQFFTGAAASTPTLTLDDSGVKIQNALELIYDSIDAVIVAVISGHCHRDYSIVSAKGFPMIATTCDTNQAAPYDPVTPDRTAGTTDEQAFDIFYINTSLRTITTVRIGAGDTTSDRSFTF